MANQSYGIKSAGGQGISTPENPQPTTLRRHNTAQNGLAVTASIFTLFKLLTLSGVEQ